MADKVRCPACLGTGKKTVSQPAFIRCFQCQGDGDVVAGSVDTDHIHRWELLPHRFDCLLEWKCDKCEAKREVDSSD